MSAFNKGDVILLADGGHGFKMLAPSEMIEVKQGPYCGERDKIRFDSVVDNQIIIDEKRYLINELPQLLGVLQHIIDISR